MIEQLIHPADLLSISTDLSFVISSALTPDRKVTLDTLCF